MDLGNVAFVIMIADAVLVTCVSLFAAILVLSPKKQPEGFYDRLFGATGTYLVGSLIAIGFLSLAQFWFGS